MISLINVPDNKKSTETMFPSGNVEVLLRRFYGHHHELVHLFVISLSYMTTDMFRLSQSRPFLMHDLSPGL
jgi:hypothetical protein